MAGRPDRRATARITDFRQVRALADPLRIRMLQLFAQEPLTTKQVADRLGEKPTRLYNHARALEQAGLIRLVRTRQNRGTTERYLEAVGSRFEVDARLFALERPRGAGKAAAYATASAVLRAAAGQLERATSEPDGPEPIVGQVSLCLTPKEYERLRARVLGWVKQVQRVRRPGPAGPRRRDALLTISLLPATAGVSPRDSRSPAGSS
jgi:DNA-binding transcriptional ArsR family regulator